MKVKYPRILRMPVNQRNSFPAFGPGGKWLRCTATLLRDSHGNLTGAMETLEDITDKKQREFQVDPGN